MLEIIKKLKKLDFIIFPEVLIFFNITSIVLLKILKN